MSTKQEMKNAYENASVNASFKNTSLQIQGQITRTVLFDHTGFRDRSSQQLSKFVEYQANRKYKCRRINRTPFLQFPRAKHPMVAMNLVYKALKLGYAIFSLFAATKIHFR